MSPARAVTLLLSRYGLAALPETSPAVDAWIVVTGDLPLANDRDNVLAVEDTGGYTQGRIFRTGERVVFPTVQVMIRSRTKALGTAKGKAVEDLLDKVGLPPELPGGLGPVAVTEAAVTVVVLAAHVTVPTSRVGTEELNSRLLHSVNVMLTLG